MKPVILASLLLAVGSVALAQDRRDNPFCDAAGVRPQVGGPADMLGKGLTDIDGNPIDYLGACSPLRTANTLPPPTLAVTLTKACDVRTLKQQTCVYLLALDPVAGADRYIIEQSVPPTIPWGDVYTLTATTQLDTIEDDPGSRVICWRGKAANSAGISGTGNEVCKTTPAIVAARPNPPSNTRVQ
jgi:hypothetical protein